MTDARRRAESPPWADGAYSVKRHGVTIANCDAEPVQTPGCIQSHGALLVLRIADFTILQVSENSREHLCHEPSSLLGAHAAMVLGSDGAAYIARALRDESIERNPLYICTLPAANGRGPLDVVLHTAQGLAIVELEPAAESSGQHQPDYYALIKKAVSHLQHATTLQEFCHRAAAEVRGVTGLDRAMIYRFHPDDHGEVIGEARRDDLPPWLGLHYPAEDIPRPAREIFTRIGVRPLPDAAAPPMELVPLVNPDTGRPLDMTHCALRGASVMYTEYLQNMGVAASLTMPIMVDGRLWGLVACHHYTPTTFPYQVRAAAEFLGQVVSLQLRAAEDREQLVYRLRLEAVHGQLVAQAAEEGGLTAMTDGAPTLLDAMDAGGAAIFHRDRWWRVGRTPTDRQLDALRTWLDTRPEFDNAARPVYATDSIARDYPAGAEWAHAASGVLAVPLSRPRRNLMLWFRPEEIQTVTWAGDPHDQPTTAGPHGPRLTPRRSFELFVESVRHRAVPWRTVEVDAALRLRVLLMELVVTRAEQLAELNADLQRSNDDLDAFAYIASHDLKEPLRGISKYAHLLLESATTLEDENRTRLSALMRLTIRMDSLLDSLLHFSRVGRATLEQEVVDLAQVVEEALEIVEARRQEVPTDILVQSMPAIVCDRVRVREVFVNLIGNGLKYNDKPRRRIEIGALTADRTDEARPQGGTLSEVVFFVRDNGIGIDRRHYGHIFKMFRRLHGRDEFGGGTGAGLTIVQKLVERHRGRIWLDSIPQVGTTFFFTLNAAAGAV